MLTLNSLKTAKKERKRVGRGNSSGHGNYSCRGMKGQRSRSGGKSGLKLRGFKQNLLNIPKMKGMKSRYPDAQVVKISQLEKNFDNGQQVNPATLLEKGLINTADLRIKILLDNGDAKLTKKLDVFDCRVSATAEKAITSAGGKILNESPKEEAKAEEKKDSKKIEDKTKK